MFMNTRLNANNIFKFEFIWVLLYLLNLSGVLELVLGDALLIKMSKWKSVLFVEGRGLGC